MKLLDVEADGEGLSICYLRRARQQLSRSCSWVASMSQACFEISKWNQ